MMDASEWIPPLNIALLGTLISVRCRFEACRQGIQAHFHPHCIDRAFRTPDFIIQCDWPHAERHLFRARPEAEAKAPLPGVWFRRLGDGHPEPWRGTYPPLPPFTLPGIRDRFVGLHAACVALGSGPVLILAGPRGSGKTTLAARLANDRGGALLTDEITCLHTRTRVVAPFAMAMGISSIREDGTLEKTPLQADRVVSHISTVSKAATTGVFLRPATARYPSLRALSQITAFRLLLTQHLDLGTVMGECLTTLADLTREIPFGELSYAGFDQADQAMEALEAFARS